MDIIHGVAPSRVSMITIFSFPPCSISHGPGVVVLLVVLAGGRFARIPLHARDASVQCLYVVVGSSSNLFHNSLA